MTDQLEHTILTTRARQLPDVGPAPPAEAPPTTPPTAPAHVTPPWPRNAKVVVAILAVATLLAAIGTFAATTGDDDGTTDQQEQIELLTAEQARLTTELEATTARVVALTTQRDELNDRIADLDAELATATADVDELTAQRVGLMAERAALQSSLAAAETRVVDLETRLDTATDVTATLDERLAVLDVQVGYLLDRAVAAEQERDAVLELFPIEFDSSLQGVDLTGGWSLRWDEAYCSGFSTCGTLPAFGRITITETPEDWLRVTADGVFDAGLFEVEGALYAITASRTAAPACGTEPRLAHVGLTLYANSVTVAEDGTHVIEDLGATFVVDAPATATCPAGIAVYGAELAAIG
jgi:hypothetical protein